MLEKKVEGDSPAIVRKPNPPESWREVAFGA